MKRKEVNTPQHTGAVHQEKKERNADSAPEKEIVIPDECGDSLWDPVLKQETKNVLPAKERDNKK